VTPFRIYFASDLHGSEVCFRKFLNSVSVYRPDLLIYGGDLMGKLLHPIFRVDDRTFRWYPSGDRPEDFPPDSLPQVERRIADQGRYSFVTTREDWEARRQSPGRLEALARELGKERVRAWLRLIRERLLPQNVRVIMNVGNDDTDSVLAILREEAPPNVLVPEGQLVSAGPYEVFGCGYANMTPWHCPRDLEEADLEKVLDRTAGQIDSPRRTIFDIHAPPRDTAIDLAPELDANLKPKTVSGQRLLTHVGSPSVRRLIESVGPVLSLHGHIHESMGIDRVGSTPVLNPGSVYFSGVLQGAILTLDGGQLVDHLFVTG
jgi:Icc-related predicted phosphoesterase